MQDLKSFCEMQEESLHFKIYQLSLYFDMVFIKNEDSEDASTPALKNLRDRS